MEGLSHFIPFAIIILVWVWMMKKFSKTDGFSWMNGNKEINEKLDEIKNILTEIKDKK